MHSATYRLRSSRPRASLPAMQDVPHRQSDRPVTVQDMKHLKVLVAYDDSAASAKALTFACELARTHDAELHVIASVQVPDVAEDAEIKQIVERARRHY